MNLALIGDDQAADHLDGRGLAGAVSAQKAKHLTAGNLQVEVVDGHHRLSLAALICLAQVGDRYGRNCSHQSSPQSMYNTL